MRRFVIFLFSVSLLADILCVSAFADIPRPRPHLPLKEPIQSIEKNHSGRWYMADDGHAVFCYGPAAMIIDAQGEIIHIATFCRDGRPVVKLKE